MRRHLAPSVAFLVACFGHFGAVEAATGLSDSKQRAIDAAVAAELDRQGVVGVAIGVLREGRIAYLQGYGLADREAGRPVTTRTVFNWASNSKPLVGVAAMQLVEAGQLDLDADVRRYVPEFPAKPRGVVTTRSLLCHQSGLPHYSNGKVEPIAPTGVNAKPCDSAVAAIERFAGSPLLFAPGDRFEYSSHAYVLLSAVVARAGGEPLIDQLHARITGPLAMRSLTTDTDDDDQADWSAGYVRKRDDRVVRASEYAHCWKHGAGAYKSNVADFAAWAAALLNGRLVQPATERAMWTPQKTNSGEATERGLGFIVEDQNGLKVSHNGSQPETRTRMVLYPEANHGVVVMCNCQFAKPGRFSTAVYKALKR